MLVALIANNQNVAPGKLPLIKIDRGGGGARWPGYQIVDIISALQLFPEIRGEHPVARAARRMRFVEEALPGVKEARERREAGAFLVGAALGERVAEEKFYSAESIAPLIRAVDAVRGAPAAPAAMHVARGAYAGSGMGGAFLLVGGGILLGLAIARATRRSPRAA